MKTVKETKLKAVKEHLDDGLTIKEVCEKYKMNPAVLKFLTALYRRHGEEPLYQKLVRDCGMIQSMSRKGNCLDNSPTENFFGRLKTEMYYPCEYEFDSLDEVKQEIIKYINYYNNERLVWKIKDSPTKYRESFYSNV